MWYTCCLHLGPNTISKMCMCRPLREADLQPSVLLWTVVQRFLTGFRPCSFPSHHWRRLMAHIPPPRPQVLSLISSDTCKWYGGDLTHTERQPDLPAECQLLAISVLSSVARALKTGQFLASEAAGLTQHIRRRLRWKRPLHVHVWGGWGACFPKEPSGPGHGPHPDTGPAGPGNSCSTWKKQKEREGGRDVGMHGWGGRRERERDIAIRQREGHHGLTEPGGILTAD